MNCSLDTEKGTSMTLLYHRIALVSVANKTCTTFSYIFDRKCYWNTSALSMRLTIG